MCDMYFGASCEDVDCLDWDGSIPESEENSVETGTKGDLLDLDDLLAL
jgi:hypothetical protein